MTGYLEAIAGWTGATRTRVDLDGHGRREFSSELDLSRSVGWFTAVYPVRLDLGDSPALHDRLRTVHRQLNAVPRDGIGYGVLRYLREDVISRTLADVGQAQLSFNYLGQVSSTARPASDERPLMRLLPRTGEVNPLPAAHYEYPLSLSVTVMDHVLEATWTYRCDLIAADTVAELASRWLDSIRRTIALADQVSSPDSNPAGR
jgi:non-ribosomal peptide synthase protein (TIGR01720 family)